jgi:hypothetical protein
LRNFSYKLFALDVQLHKIPPADPIRRKVLRVLEWRLKEYGRHPQGQFNEAGTGIELRGKMYEGNKKNRRGRFACVRVRPGGRFAGDATTKRNSACTCFILQDLCESARNRIGRSSFASVFAVLS